MKIKVDMDIDFEADKMIDEIISPEFYQHFAEEATKLMEKYVPMRTGSLIDHVDIGPGYVEYIEPYAHYMYEGKLYVDPKTGKGASRDPDTGHIRSRTDADKVKTDTPLKYNTEKNSLATSKWDEAMMKAHKDELIKSLQDWLEGKR